MLISLEEMGFVEKGNDTKYRLGLLFLTYGNLVSSRLDIRQIAFHIMQDLHKELKEAINLIVEKAMKQFTLRKWIIIKKFDYILQSEEEAHFMQELVHACYYLFYQIMKLTLI